MIHLHPANQQRHEDLSLGDRAADRASQVMGSWRFIGGQTAFIVVWITLNLVAIVYHWDPYPFILLNLAFSTQAAYATPLLLLSQNRQTEHDRVRAEEDYRVNQEALELLRALATEFSVSTSEKAAIDEEEDTNEDH